MFFRKKGWLRREYDQHLLNHLGDMKKNWMIHKSLLDKSLDPSEDIIVSAKIAEAKYFYLFKEAKQRNIQVQRTW
ncbi:YaaL family protein [Peribacillus acanthi]|uniref:YaaL family protein n=1 Tax=Peribacillus acanthi TaxID=2171554 RepID=UPI000D3EC092|nr:YaaL family protein [Peribacillus acanthi]